ncbi:tetratricopeptide repeat protein [uncultured Winogradskyella sp.]|uniref:tetratricopeptide repeat protein n=1 Tax=uncultured Winogradskyella sp. TaxID=395353 RepID=UPI002615E5AF|nr:tetratricopeptide repeat protein [uncultured Winogradskyella sp.]
MRKNTNKSFLEKLWNRKIPQYLGTYLAVGFGLFQFIQSVIIQRYGISDIWQDRYLFIWLILTPAVFVLVYFGYQPNGKEVYEKKKWPRYFIITNIIIGLGIGLFLIKGKDKIKDRETELIALVDEEGKEFKAIVPDLKKVKSIALFQFENLTDNRELDWMGVAMSTLLDFNLEQRPEFYVTSSFELSPHYQKLGVPLFTTPNIAVQRNISKQSRNDYFTKITFKKTDGIYTFSGDLYQTKNNKSILKMNVSNADIFIALDAIRDQIFEAISTDYDVKDRDLANFDNNFTLPASALVTSNVKALEYYIKSSITLFKNPSALNELIAEGKKAIELDPNCSMCYLTVGGAYFGQGNQAESLKYLKNAIKYGAALPKRMQFYPKQMFYSLQNNSDALIKLLEFHKDLYPYDFNTYKLLLTRYTINGGVEQAKALMQKAIEKGNRELGLLELYKIQISNNDFDDAKSSLDQLTKEFPEREQNRLLYADLYEEQGKITEAKTILLKEESLDPFNTSIQRRIAYLDFINLNFEDALKRIDKGLSEATSLSDSLSYMRSKYSYAHSMGQVNKALSLIKDYEELAIKQQPIINVMFSNYTKKTLLYQSTGQLEGVEHVIEQLGTFMPNSYDNFRCGINLQAIYYGYPLVGDTSDYLLCKDLVFKTQGEGFVDLFNLSKAYIEKKYSKCIEVFENSSADLEKLIGFKFFIADVFYKSGNSKRALEIMRNEIAKKTQDPLNYLKLAEILEKEDKTESRKYLDITLRFLANADANYIPLQKAKALEKRLGA